ncbi:hypothetical protein DYB34_010393, partial [Aphanomyces astaci]
ALAATAAMGHAKISAQVHRELQAGGTAQDLVVNFRRVDIEALVLPESTDYVHQLVQTLSDHSNKSKQVVADLLGARVESACEDKFFYIDNTYFPCDKLTEAQVRNLAASPHVASIAKAAVMELSPVQSTSNNATVIATANQWGVDKISSPLAWAKGKRGAGVVVANIDTGVRQSHNAVKNNWRADFGWYDPSGGASVTPKDYQGHGSHTMGTIVGQVNGIGVAPDAKWIACVGCSSSSCAQADLTACAQWLLCPTNSQGVQDCTKAPHVINNSWGSTNGQATWFLPMVAAWRAAGIIPVFSNGNSGSVCGTVGSPGMSPDVIGVGASDASDALAYFSSRGPTYDNRIKPDISAPGTDIVSIDFNTDNGYAYMSGTSMAAPHVTGAVAIYLSANPGASYAQVYAALTGSVDKGSLTPNNQNCGGVSDSTYPNNNYGYAKISAQVHRELLVEGVVQEVVVNFVPVNLDSMVLLDASDANRSGLVDALIAQSKKAKRVVDNVLGIRINGHCDKFFYIDNTFFPCGSLTTNEIRALANSPSVQTISKAVVARVNPLKVTAFESDAAAAAANQWGVDKIQASAVWATNATGTGIVVANIDTGVRLTHEAVSSNWRSDFGWFDPDAGSTTPSDSNGHGTHVMGTIAGQVNGIGVAPGAKWIACLGCPNSSCPQATLTACAQWLLCPTDALGNKDCTKAPHVINNSWGSTDGASTWFEPSISAWRAAGIIPVFSNGNSGNDCGTVGSPGMSPQVIAVGATDSTDGLAYFSSRGPTYDNRIKPDLAAPGVNIVSAYAATDTTYAYMSGTSMAAPHVTGAVALYLSANPTATFADVFMALTTTVDTNELVIQSQSCGGISDAKYPNNNFGYGRLNIERATKTIVY